MSSETMDRIMDENYAENKRRVRNKSMANERRVLAPIVAKSSNLMTDNNQLKAKTRASEHLRYKQPKQWPKGRTVSAGVVKTNDESIKTTKIFGQKSSDFTIFCDKSDSETNVSNDENEFEIDISFDDMKEDMDSCEQTDHMLSEQTENSLAIEEELIDELSEREIRCEETIEVVDDDEDLEDASTSEHTSETVRSFDLTVLSRCKEYADEVHRYLLSYERTRMADPFYIAKQPEINAKMRSVLIDWLVEVTEEYKLLDQTLFLAVAYIDRFLSLMSVSRQSFQLLGTAALFIASKYEEIYPPELSEFVYITDDSYSKQQILNMEKLILKALQYDVSAPTTYYFIEKILSDLEVEPIVKHLAKYLCHLTLLESEPFLRYYPSEIAICAVVLSAQTLGFVSMVSKQFIEKTIDFERQLKSGDVKHFLAERQACMEALHRMHSFAHKHPQQAIQTKYTSDKYYRVSIVEPMASAPIY